jgi:hypothetical protein
MPDEPLVGAAAVNALLRGWRAELNRGAPVDSGDGQLEQLPAQLEPEQATEGEPVT